MNQGATQQQQQAAQQQNTSRRQQQTNKEASIHLVLDCPLALPLRVLAC
jgi:hypothetical protein